MTSLTAGLRPRPGHLLFLVAALAALAIDVVTKTVAQQRLVPLPDDAVAPSAFLSVGLVHNPAALFGIGAGHPLLLAIFHLAAISMAIGLTIVCWRMVLEADVLGVVGLGLTAGGMAGNTLERVVSRSVTDFLVVRVSDEGIVVINLADVLLWVGVALALIGLRRTLLRWWRGT